MPLQLVWDGTSHKTKLGNTVEMMLAERGLTLCTILLYVQLLKAAFFPGDTFGVTHHYNSLPAKPLNPAVIAPAGSRRSFCLMLVQCVLTIIADK